MISSSTKDNLKLVSVRKSIGNEKNAPLECEKDEEINIYFYQFQNKSGLSIKTMARRDSIDVPLPASGQGLSHIAYVISIE